MTSLKAPTTSLDVLWEPIRIGSLTIKNRVFVPAHEPVLGVGGESGGLLGDRYVEYLAARARGGAGLVMTGGASVHPKGEHFSHLPIYKQECVPRYRALADAVEEHGAKAFVQLFHCGVQDLGTDRLDDWHAPIGPSAVPSPLMMRKAKAMDRADIEEAVAAFAQSAAYMQEAGIHGVEIGGGHGYLIGQFLSPIYNYRTDEYGGSLENRSRLALEIGQAIRDRCGRDYALGIRLSYDEFMGPVGIQPDESDEIVRILHASGLFDFFNVSGITYHTFHFLAAPMTAERDSHFVPNAARAKTVVNGEVPVMVASVIKDIHSAAKAVAAGDADLVGMVRAHMADPDLVRKAQAGRASEIRRCVGANQGCIRRYIARNMITCTVNPLVGRESSLGVASQTQATERRRVLVVGGGPAGMKAAETAAARGHDVTLIERGDRLGGSLLLAGALPQRSRWLDVAEDLVGSLDRLGVEVRLGTDATLENVRELDPDLTVVATGATYDRSGWSISLPMRDGIPGADKEHVITAAEAIEDPSRCGKSVLIVDDNGDHLPHGVALLLAQDGRDVEIVSTQLFASMGLVVTNDLGWVYPRLIEAKVKVSSQTYVTEIRNGDAEVSDIWGSETRTVPAETVVLCLTRSSNESLFDALSAEGLAVQRIGDCVAPREVDDAMYEGVKCGSEI
jgi:2,4-dienoyl-CoA reductase-like NADH-dependent reductase (Old Yellow Enzyme family)